MLISSIVALAAVSADTLFKILGVTEVAITVTAFLTPGSGNSSSSTNSSSEEYKTYEYYQKANYDYWSRLSNTTQEYLIYHNDYLRDRQDLNNLKGTLEIAEKVSRIGGEYRIIFK